MSLRRVPVRVVAIMSALLLSVVAVGPSHRATASGQENSYIVVYGSPSQVDRGAVEQHGDTIQSDLGAAGVLVVRSNDPATLASLPGVTSVARDRIRVRTPHEEVTQVDTDAPAPASTGCASTTASCDRQWDLARIHVPQAWTVTQGSSAIKVAVLDTGLTSGHVEVGANYDRVNSKSFVTPSSFCPADAATFASTEDFHGHGTWTATHVAGVNGARMTGIAPKTTLINLRVLGACGFGLDSWILNAMLYGNTVGARVESMSLGGFVCADGVVPGSFYCGDAASVGNDPAVWQAYVQVVAYLRAHGTIVVAAAGNDHLQLNAAGRVVSHGTLADCTVGADPCNDYYGLSESPGGVPGVVAVAATNRVSAVGAPSDTKYGQYGAGLRDQLTYYSNYGERVDVSAPGGARNFNIARFDCLTANCGRLGASVGSTTDNPGDYGAWGVDAAGAPCTTCYAYVQGTSMATPQVAGVAALALAAQPELTPRQLVRVLRHSTTEFINDNATPAIATDPASPHYNFDVNYGAPGTSNALMGQGIIDAAIAVGAGDEHGDQSNGHNGNNN